MGQDGALLIELNAEQTAGEFFNDGAGDFNAVFFTHCPLFMGISLLSWYQKCEGKQTEKLGKSSACVSAQCDESQHLARLFLRALPFRRRPWKTGSTLACLTELPRLSAPSPA